jgi:hypothetical protein
MNRQGFEVNCMQNDRDTLLAEFVPKRKKLFENNIPNENINIRFEPDVKYYYFFTKSLPDFQEGKQKLLKESFFCGDKESIEKLTPIFFQKANMTVLATYSGSDSNRNYLFLLKLKKIPTEVATADDLLQFDSYQYLSSFFGPQNIKSDLYYFTRNELKKCSVLYSGTKMQAVFIWNDEHNMDHLSYIIISNGLPTIGTQNSASASGLGEWPFKSGIFTGMDIKDLIRINQADFSVYGGKSELAFMIDPDNDGKIDFKKTAVMLSCDQCEESPVFNQPLVSALDLVKAHLTLKVHDIILYP